jgi:hypothetical protein
VLKDVIAPMVDIYSFGGVPAEDIVMRITLQMIECGIFILHYTYSTGKGLILSSPHR